MKISFKQAIKKTQLPITLNIYIATAIRMSILLGVYAICRIILYLFNTSFFPDMDINMFLNILFGGVRFDISALNYINSLYLLLQVIPFTFRYRPNYQHFCKWLFIITNSIGIALNFIDCAYYKFTLKRTTSSVFMQFSGEHNKLKLGLTFLFNYWYLLLLFIVLIWTLIKLYDLVSIKKETPKNIYLYGLTRSAIMLFISTMVIIGMRGGMWDGMPITPNYAGEYVKTPNEVSLVLNTPFCLMQTLEVRPMQKKDYFDITALTQLYNPIHQPQSAGPFKPLNVVIIILESLGKEHVGGLNKNLLGGTYKGYTPFIDSLLGHSLVFTNAYANGRQSMDAPPAILSSIPRMDEHFVLTPYATNRVGGLPFELRKKGYHTSFFHGASNGSMGFLSFANLSGIEHYYGRTEYNNDADFDGMWGIWDEPFFQFFAREINKIKPPFCSTIFTTTSHHPFSIPKEYEGKLTQGPLPIQQCYNYTDIALQKFFATASKMPWFNNTLFVITADHAAQTCIPEYGNTVGHYAVPLLVYYPGGNLKGKVNKLAQHIDLMPTLLSYLNYDKPYFAFGNNLFEQNDDNFVVTNNDGIYNFYFKNHLLFYDGNKSIGFYDYKADRFLKNNLLGLNKTLEQQIEIKLKAFIQQFNNRMIDNQLSID